MKVYDYKSYDEYLTNQMAANKRKLGWTFKGRNRINWIKNYKKEAANIICHGTRSGIEQQDFKDLYSEAFIIGTEISDTATQFPMTVQHDFALVKEEWIGKFDIIYSNSFDHSFDPHVTIETWKDQLSSTGKMFLEWNIIHNSKSIITDPVSGTLEEFKDFLINHNITIEKVNGFGSSLYILVCTNTV